MLNPILTRIGTYALAAYGAYSLYDRLERGEPLDRDTTSRVMAFQKTLNLSTPIQLNKSSSLALGLGLVPWDKRYLFVPSAATTPNWDYRVQHSLVQAAGNYAAVDLALTGFSMWTIAFLTSSIFLTALVGGGVLAYVARDTNVQADRFLSKNKLVFTPVLTADKNALKEAGRRVIQNIYTYINEYRPELISLMGRVITLDDARDRLLALIDKAAAFWYDERIKAYGSPPAYS